MISGASEEELIETSGRSDVLLEFMPKIKQLQQENKQLKAQTEEYQKALDETMSEKIDTQNNWNKLKEWVNKHYEYYMNEEDYIGGRLCFTDMKNKMQELEAKK